MQAERRPLAPRSYFALAVLVIALGLALRAPVLTAGFTVDDYAQLAMMKGRYPLPRGALELFSFSRGSAAENARLRATGFFPWWSHPELKVALFRPLSSSLMWLDLALFGGNAFAYHVHSAAWWLAMMACLAGVLWRLLEPAPALIALVLCTAHGAHLMLLGWIANRNAAVASAWALLGLWLQLSPAARGTPRRRALALAAFGIALAASEYAVGFLPYALAIELAQSERSTRVRRSMPWLALFAVYALVRTGLGFGTRGSGMYIDPLFESGAFLCAALARAPVLSADLVLGLPAHFFSTGFPLAAVLAERGLLSWSAARDLEAWRSLHVAIGAVALLGATAIARAVVRGPVGDGPRELRAFALATPFSLVVSLGSVPESRLLVPSLVGWSVLLVSALQTALRAHTRSRARASRAAFAGLYLLAASEVLFPPLASMEAVRGMPRLTAAVRASLLAPELDAQLRGAHRVMLVAAADPTTTIYLPLVRALYGRPGPRQCLLLASGFVPQRLVRLSSRSFTLERLEDALTAGDIYATAFNREPLEAARRFEADGLAVVIERAYAGRAFRARYELDAALDDPRTVLLIQTRNGLRRIAFPPLGASVVLPPPVVPLGLSEHR